MLQCERGPYLPGVLIGTVAGFGIADNLSGVVLPDVSADDGEQA